MKKDIAELWISALLSHEYKQGNSYLCTQEKAGSPRKYYCCLGVLTDLYLKKHNEQWEKWGTIEEEETGQIIYGVGPHDCYLPPEVVKWAGMKSRYGKYGKGEDRLTNDNDQKLKTFPEIAQIIRENVEKL